MSKYVKIIAVMLAIAWGSRSASASFLYWADQARLDYVDHADHFVAKAKGDKSFRLEHKSKPVEITFNTISNKVCSASDKFSCGKTDSSDVSSKYVCSSVPEPTTSSLFGVGIASVGFYAWRRRKLAKAVA